MATPYNHKEIENKWRLNWEKNPVNVDDGKKPKYTTDNLYILYFLFHEEFEKQYLFYLLRVFGKGCAPHNKILYSVYPSGNWKFTMLVKRSTCQEWSCSVFFWPLKTDMVDTRRMQRTESSGKTFMAV